MIVRRHRAPDPVPAEALEPDHAYAGPAVLTTGTGTVVADVCLNGHFEPLDGHFHWYGRIDGAELGALAGSARARLSLSVGTGAPRPALLGERDPWGHHRISGTGAPPYPLDAVEVDVPLP